MNGKLGITFCPGKKCNSLVNRLYWNRNLDQDIAILVKENVNLVITLIEKHEFKNLKVQNLGHKIIQNNIDWIWIPLRDTSIPTESFIQHYKSILPKVVILLFTAEED